MKHFLILGYPRSGTSYAAVAFHKVGLYVTHERDETIVKRLTGTTKIPDGVVTGLFLGCERNLDKYDIILHQVRNPLHVLTSAQRMKYRSLCDVAQTCGLPDPATMPHDKLWRIMKTWLVFTEWADSVAAVTFQVERLRDFWMTLLEILDLEVSAPFPQRLNTYTNTYGSKRPKQLTWQDLYECDEMMGKAIMEKCLAYGYPLDHT